MAAGEAQLLGDTAHLAHVSAKGGGVAGHTGKKPRGGVWEGEQTDRQGLGWEGGGWWQEGGGGRLYLRGPSAGSAAMRAASWQDAEAARLTHV